METHALRTDCIKTILKRSVITFRSRYRHAPSECDEPMTVRETIEELRELFELERRERELRDGPHRRRHATAFADEIDQILAEHVGAWEKRIADRLRALMQFPEQHDRHRTRPEEFHRVASFGESVFIMTKFPEGDRARDRELRQVIAAVEGAVTNAGFTPRIATRTYHPQLWDNVELDRCASC